MKTITVIGNFNFNPEQKARLEALGKVRFLPNPGSAQEWLGLVQGSDVICSDGFSLLANLYDLKNVFVTYPYIELGVFDSKKLEENGVTIANTQGSNRDSIVEWVMFMILSLFRKFPSVLNVTHDIPLELSQSLSGKDLLVVGKGNIGTKIGTVCESFGMSVDFFLRGESLSKKAKYADVIVNSLNCNSTSRNLLDENFFMSLKPKAYYVSFVRQYTYDLEGLIKALDKGIVAGAAIDCDPEAPGNTSNDFYQRVLNHKKILATPHIAFATAQAKANGAEEVVKNIESYIQGRPRN